MLLENPERASASLAPFAGDDEQFPPRIAVEPRHAAFSMISDLD